MSLSETSGDADRPTGLIAEMDSMTALARALNSHVTPQSARVELEFSAAGPVGQLVLRVIGLDGTKSSSSDIDEVNDAVVKLREAMYREGSGTWFSTRIILTSDKSLDASYNYDNPPPTAFEFSPRSFAADLEQFPRDDNHIPDWLRKKLL